MRATSSLFVCLLMAAAGGAFAQTSDVMSMTVGRACKQESGTAARLCGEYCAEMTCHRANDGDDATQSEASAEECKRPRTRLR
ncbi:MAG: hypothetical protein GY778_27855, partial [bacterium]|nr:hypothetical protein [bacterium]